MPRRQCALLLLAATIHCRSTRDVADDDTRCPLPPEQSAYRPATRTALASHPRCGSTWLRFLVERVSGHPTGAERKAWANVLGHFGGEADPNMPNRDGVLVKTHSLCYGCWPGANVKAERFTVEQNTSFGKTKVGEILGKKRAEQLFALGHCIKHPQFDLDKHLRAISRGRTREPVGDHLQCDFLYSSAVILIRDPLDAIKSNYHFRSEVLGMISPGTWSKDDYAFPRERARSFVEFYRSWTRFGEFNPTMVVRFEDLKSDVMDQLRRLANFLNFTIKGLEGKVECAARMSTIDKLKETSNVRYEMRAEKFFGSRGDTEARELLVYPDSLLDDFESMGLFEVREAYGYGPRSALQSSEREQIGGGSNSEL